MTTQKLRSCILVGIMVLSALAVAPVGSAATTSELSLQPVEGDSVETGNTATYEVVLGTVDNGVGAWNYTVSVSNASVATITDANLDTAADDATAGGTAEISDDGSSVTFDGFATESQQSTGSDFVLATVTVKGEAVGSTSLDLSVDYFEDTDNSQYTLDPVTDGSFQVESLPPVTASITPSEGSVANEGYSLYSVSVSNVSNGIGAYNFTVTTADEQTVEIVGTEQGLEGGEFSTFSADVASNNASVQIEGVTSGGVQGNDITLAKIRVYGAQKGSSSLGVSFADGYLQGVNSSISYTVEETTSASVTVRAPPNPVDDGGSAPADQDKDGKYEDVDGNGVLDGRDVITLWNNRDTINNDNFFDYNGDGVVDARDVLQLWLSAK